MLMGVLQTNRRPPVLRPVGRAPRTQYWRGGGSALAGVPMTFLHVPLMPCPTAFPLGIQYCSPSSGGQLVVNMCPVCLSSHKDQEGSEGIAEEASGEEVGA